MSRASGSMLARAGYALAGTLVAVLVAWLLSLVVPHAHPGFLELVAFVAAMAAALMVWAASKPSHGSPRSVALEALVVFVTMMLVQMGSDGLRLTGMLGYHPSALSWLWDHVMFMLYSGLGLVLPAAWALGSSERWTRRSWGWVAGEVVFALLAGALAWTGMLDLSSTLIGFAIQGLVFVAAALAIAAVLQRVVCEIVWRVRGVRPMPGQARPRHAETARPPAPRNKVRAAGVAVLVGTAALCVASLAFFFACSAYARANGLELRTVAYGVPSVCVLLTVFVVVPFVAVEAMTGRPKDRRLAGCAVLGGLVLFAVMFSATFRLDPPEEIEMADGTLALVASAWQGNDRVAYADAVGPLFRRPRSAPPRAVQQPDEGAGIPVTPRQGYTYHNTGVVTAIDVDARTLELAITQSTEDFETGAHVKVDCASAEYFDVPLEQLAVGDSVQIRSTEAQAGGTVVAQKVFAATDAAQAEAAANGGAEEGESLDDVLEELSCPYTVSGTVTSAVEENGFAFRVDDGGGFIDNGTELQVSTAFVERRLYGMKGLQWGMDGVIIGFSDLPAEGVLRAKVIVGNDDTSSDYWENIQIVN